VGWPRTKAELESPRGKLIRAACGMAMKRFVCVILSALCACPASAATIMAQQSSTRGAGAIIIFGTLQPGDDETLSQHLKQFRKGIVVFQGDGGSLLTAIRIGTAIRLRHFATLVADESICASACAVAWLGGTPRIMEDGAKIGFHAAYTLKDGQAAEGSVPNALLGAYLGKIGLPDRAVIYVTSAPPEGMTWLGPDDAGKMGIEVRKFTRPEEPLPLSISRAVPPRSQSAHVQKPPMPPIRPHRSAKRDPYFVSLLTHALRQLDVKPANQKRDTAPGSH
jgi:hypothetical protein